MQKLNDQVKEYWEVETCGTSRIAVGDKEKYSVDWYQEIEYYRYEAEPFIFQLAQFTRYHGRKILEIGVGAGTDHLQWAKAGCKCFGVDLTEAAIETTQKLFELNGFKSDLHVIDAEKLPFEDNSFDVIYSWGVIHHSENPELIIKEIRRVLKPDGEFIGMFYNLFSLTVFRYWAKFALLKGRPWINFKSVVYKHIESIGTKAYTKKELKKLFIDFDIVQISPLLTKGDFHRIPKFLRSWIPNKFGWFYGIRARLKSQLQR